jgi:hypothetical protein
MNTQTKTQTKTTKTVFKWIWGWQDEKEEAWLGEMAARGWHLLPGMLPGFYKFERGEPAEMLYRLDYFSPAKQQRADYLQLFQDSGWEHVGEMTGWQYFRKPAQAGGSTEIYSDPQSKVEKYKRLLAFLGILSPIFLMYLVMLSDPQPTPLGRVLNVLMVILLVFNAYAAWMLLRRIQQLQRS